MLCQIALFLSIEHPGSLRGSTIVHIWISTKVVLQLYLHYQKGDILLVSKFRAMQSPRKKKYMFALLEFITLRIFLYRLRKI